MIKLLARIFITNHENYSDANVRREYGVLLGTVGIILNLILCFLKMMAGIISSSMAIIGDAFNNLSDAGSSVIMLVGFRMAGHEPDPDHPFGHGRIEYITGLIVSMIIIVIGVELGKSSIGKIISPEVVNTDTTMYFILIVSILVKMYMFYYNRNTAQRFDSTAMKATSMDSFMDAIATTLVLISMVIYEFFGVTIDGWAGLLVAVFIIYNGIAAAKETVDPLLGTKPNKEYIDSIEKFVTSQKGILGIHDVVVHDYGPGRCMVSLHAEVPANGDILEIHDTIDNTEHKLKEILGCDAVIHMDPVVTDDAVTGRMRDFTKLVVKGVDEALSMHDFRMVQGPTHTNLIFDVVVPYQFRLTDEQVIDEIQKKIKELPGNHYAVINVDRPYV